MPDKQTGKKHGKGTMKAGDGFASVAYDSHRKQLVPRFTNRKDVGFPWKRSSKLTSKRSCTTRLLRLFAAACKCCHSARKSRNVNDHVIGRLRTRIQIVGEIKVNRFHTLGFPVL